MTEWLHEEQDLANEAVDGDGGVRDGTRGQTRGVGNSPLAALKGVAAEHPESRWGAVKLSEG